MSLDLTLLRVLKYADRHKRLSRAVPKHVLDPLTQTVLDDVAAFFAEFPDQARLPHQEFFTYFKMRHPTLTPEQFVAYEHLLKQVQEDVPADLEAGIMSRLVAADTAHKVLGMIERWNRGEEVDLYIELRNAVEKFEQDTDRKVKVPWVTTTIAELLAMEENDVGLHWRLSCLNLSMRPMRGGDFGVIAGRPDKGKTTFITDQATHFAPQIAKMFSNERDIIWFNNEGPGARIIQRLYQSALDKTIPELVELHHQPSKTHQHKLDEMYAEAMGGRLDTIKIMDVHDYWSHELEDIMRSKPPGLVIWDMIDNVKFGGTATNGGERTDQLLEAMYQWVRVLSVKYDVPMLATSQISADGENERFPRLSQLKDSKTGKQGAAEFIMTLGAVEDPTFDSSRFIGLTKNKLHRSTGPKSPNCEVIFDPTRGRYRMPNVL